MTRRMLSLLAFGALLVGATAAPAAGVLAQELQVNDGSYCTVAEDDFAGLLGFAILAVVVLIALGILAAIVGLLVMLTVMLFLMLGILSTSTAYALLQRKPSDLVQALLVQLSAALGAVSGVVVCTLIDWLAKLDLVFEHQVIVGGIAGLVAGAAVGLLLVWTGGGLLRLCLDRIKARCSEQGPAL